MSSTELVAELKRSMERLALCAFLGGLLTGVGLGYLLGVLI